MTFKNYTLPSPLIPVIIITGVHHAIVLKIVLLIFIDLKCVRRPVSHGRVSHVFSLHYVHTRNIGEKKVRSRSAATSPLAHFTWTLIIIIRELTTSIKTRHSFAKFECTRTKRETRIKVTRRKYCHLRFYFSIDNISLYNTYNLKFNYEYSRRKEAYTFYGVLLFKKSKTFILYQRTDDQ